MIKKNLFKAIVAPIFDDSLAKQEKTFYLLAIMALLAFALAILVTIFMAYPLAQVLIRVAIWLAFFFLAFFSIRIHKLKPVIYISSTFLTFILLPFNFFSSGGIGGGCAIWNLFGIICVLYMIETRIKFALAAGNLAVFAACCAAEYFYPELLVPFSGAELFFKTIISTLIASLMIFFLVLFQNMLYKKENETAQGQRKEIEELNLAQNRFFSSMSHELRTPINTIVGLNEMILREKDISPEVMEDAARMQSAGRMLLSLVNDILDMSKIEAGKMEIVPAPYDTGSLLSEVVNMVWFPAKEKGLEFNLNVSGSIPARLVGDETRIKQILINILNNAVKYTPKGSVTLSVQCEKSSGDESVVDVIYSIADTGIGIRQESVPQLFTVFKRVDLEKTKYIEGTGLGLSIVKQLVDLMGGTIEVNSVYTQGSTFIVMLPQAIEGDGELDAASIKASHVLSRGQRRAANFTSPDARVLIVDDNEENLLVAEKLLSETQAKIDTAASGAEALEKTQGIRYDVIFMDHLMPEMDGIECLHEIRGQEDGLNAGTPVVALTANAGSESRALYMREGFDGILVKPISGKQLEDELLRCLPRELVKGAGDDDVNEVLETPLHYGRHKASIMIATDYSADIPDEAVRKSGIAVIPSAVATEGGEFLDGIEVDHDSLMRYLEGGGKKIASLDHSSEDYTAFFAGCLAEAQRVIYLPISAAIVNHYAVAAEAARSFASVSVFDSWHLSSGLGLMALKAAEYARQGMEAEKILEELDILRDKIQTSFVVNDTKYLLNARRISKVVCKLCDVLMLHPVILLKKGRMGVGTIKTGTESSVCQKYVKWALRSRGKIDTSVAFVTYAGIGEHKLREIEREIRLIVGFERLYFQKASAAISANCGPGTFGILFMRKA